MTHDEAKAKARGLVEQMTVEEAASQLLYRSPAIARLGIHEYNWWNEALHGVARAGTATVFPQAIGLGATFDPALVERVARTIAVEARAKYNQSVRFGDRDIFKGLTYWSPNINIFRDPRWGRGQETYGEDPYLTSRMGCCFIRGLQGDGAFLTAAACAKHFAAHSGPEKGRHGFDARVSKKDLWETYLPAFEKAVREADVQGVMGAYNALNGVPCCVSTELLEDILRRQWDFDGYVTSDCEALADVHGDHHFTTDAAGTAALALRRGCHLNCGRVYDHLPEALAQGLITEEEIRAAAVQVLAIRCRLGEFEEERPYSDIPLSVLASPEHAALNRRAARESLVLLKNENDFLPLGEERFRRIAVVGPNGMSRTALEGNYNGRAGQYITVADGIRARFPKAQILVEEGANLWHEQRDDWGGFGYLLSAGAAAAAASDLTVLCLGLDSTLEGEDGMVSGGWGEDGDKNDLYLPATQQRLAEVICDNCKNVVVVLMAGSCIDLGERVTGHAKAIIQAWYPGALGGEAVAALLAGDFSPSGRLPVTFYRGTDPLPDFTDYGMAGRTYRYLTEPPRYPFGYGLSYTRFAYRELTIHTKDSALLVEVTVENTGDRTGKETVQIYAQYKDSRCQTPHFQLCGLMPVELAPGDARRVCVPVERWWLRAVTDTGERVEPDGGLILYVGGHQPDGRSEELTGTSCLSVTLS